MSKAIKISGKFRRKQAQASKITLDAEERALFRRVVMGRCDLNGLISDKEDIAWLGAEMCVRAYSREVLQHKKMLWLEHETGIIKASGVTHGQEMIDSVVRLHQTWDQRGLPAIHDGLYGLCAKILALPEGKPQIGPEQIRLPRAKRNADPDARHRHDT